MNQDDVWTVDGAAVQGVGGSTFQLSVSHLGCPVRHSRGNVDQAV